MAAGANIMKCKSYLDNLVSENVDLQGRGAAVRNRAREMLASSELCQDVGEHDMFDILNQYYAHDATEIGLRRSPLLKQYQAESRDVVEMKHRAFVKGFITVALVLGLLAFIFYKIVFNNKTVLYIGAGVVLLILTAGAGRMLYLYGFAGIGQRFRYVTDSGTTGSRAASGGNDQWTFSSQ
jgi:hypothetical protein